MKKVTYICDICGEVGKPYERHVYYKGSTIMYELDLCNFCKDDIEFFIEVGDNSINGHYHLKSLLNKIKDRNEIPSTR